MVVNYDNFFLAPDLTDCYTAVVRRLGERYYASVTRYTTSSFMRLKLSERLSDRRLAPHIYESRQEAMKWLGSDIISPELGGVAPAAGEAASTEGVIDRALRLGRGDG